MSTTELVLAIVGGVAIAALMCWAVVLGAIRLTRRPRRPRPGRAGGRGSRGA